MLDLPSGYATELKGVEVVKSNVTSCLSPKQSNRTIYSLNSGHVVPITTCVTEQQFLLESFLSPTNERMQQGNAYEARQISRSKPKCKDLCWKVRSTIVYNLVLRSYFMHELLNQHISIG